MVKFTKLAAATALISAPLLAIGSATAAEASTQHFSPRPSAEGHVALAAPQQYAEFRAFASNRGWISYTNFEYQAASDVWNISGATSLMFTSGGSTFSHTLKVTSFAPVSPFASIFRGTGYYDGNPATTWAIRGFTAFSHVDFRIVYTGGPDAGYSLRARGTIAANGSVSGQAVDSRGNHLGFTMPVGSAFSVLHYHAAVTCAVIRPSHHHRHGGNARFGFTIPASAPAGLAGTPIVVKVHDGGFGSARDTWAHGVATSRCQGAVTQYPITRGDITVRR